MIRFTCFGEGKWGLVGLTSRWFSKCLSYSSIMIVWKWIKELPYLQLSWMWYVVCWSQMVQYYNQTLLLWLSFSDFSKTELAKMAGTEKNDTIVYNCVISRMNSIYSNLFLMANIELLIIRKHGKLTIFLKLLHILIHISKIFINNFFPLTDLGGIWIHLFNFVDSAHSSLTSDVFRSM